MKKFYIFAILCLGLFVNNLQGQKNMDPISKKQNELKVDTRIDNMGYWTRMAEKGLVPINQVVQIKPADFKGNNIEVKGVKFLDSPDVPVSNATNLTESENSIFIDPNDNDYLLNSNNSTSWSGITVTTLYGANYFQSANAGLTWGGSSGGAGGTNQGDPTTAINFSGRQFVGYIINDGQGVSYSDNGSTWNAVIVAPNPGSLADKNHMWIDNSPMSRIQGSLYNAWTPFGGSEDSEIVISRSTDDGVTWSAAETISSDINALSHNQGVNIQTGSNGEVYVVWTVYDGWPTDETALGFAKSINGGISYNPSSRIISNIRGIRTTETSKNHRVNSFPAMAVDISGGPNNGNIYIVWSNVGTPGINTGTNISVYMIRSTNGGSSWSSPIRVNQGLNSNDYESYFPWITCDPVTGVLSVVFYDDRNSASHPSSDCETFVAYSFDAGNSWTDFRVSDVSFTPTPISGLAGGYMGDYNAISSRGGKVYPCWTDTRNSLFMTYVSPFEFDHLDAAFTTNDAIICAGDSITFKEYSTGSPNSWTWSFPGGTPNSYVGQNPPTITYDNPGSYNVTLIVEDGATNDTEIKTGFITVDDIIAEFAGDITTVVVGNSVTFTDNSYCDPTSWIWSFPGGTPNSATGPGPHTITYNNLGAYDVSLTVANGPSNDTETKTDFIDVTILSYCTPTYTTGTGLGDFISLVQLGDINNATGASSSPYYTYYSSLSTDLTQDESYTITLSPGDYESGNNIAVWIDYNRDGMFNETTEKLGTILVDPMPATGTINFTVPADAVVGTTRMRVREVWSNTNFNSCDSYSYGETEDYDVNILGTDIRLNLKAFLEGPFNGTIMDANIVPYLSLSQPFNIAPWNYTGTESVGSIPNTNVVEWVLIDVRDASSAASALSGTSIARQAAFILNDGSIVGLDGSSNLVFEVSISQNLFVVVMQRNHLGIISNDPLIASGGVYNYDYTTGINQVFGGIDGHKQVSIGIWGMIGGDANHDGTVNINDKSPVWEGQVGEKGYKFGDHNLDGEIDNQDKDDIWVPNETKSSQVPN